jgi:mannose-6-phosphate isomerase-like protein (cupin superfamily)
MAKMKKIFVLAAVPAAFACGVWMAPGLQTAHAQAAGMNAEVIDLAAITNADLGAIVPNAGTIRSKTLVQMPGGTIAVQTGDAPKHTHAQSDEIQYVISGEGTFWLGAEARKVHAGDLIVVPKGTVHGGSVAASGEFKTLAIKLPPPVKGDTQRVE